MAGLNDWDVIAGNNNDAPPDGWPEGTMQYSGVNNSGRENMAVLARYYSDINGTLQFAGAADSYTVTLNESYGAYFAGMYITAEINLTNTGPTTLNVNGLGLQSITKRDGSALNANALIAGGIYEMRYDGTNFQLMGTIADIADLSIGSLELSDTSTVDLSNDIAPLVISPGSGQHLELDGNDVQSKSDETTAAQLNLNRFGGTVAIGAQSGNGNVELYVDGIRRFRTSTIAGNVDLLASINTASPPTAEAVTAAYMFRDLDASDILGNLGFSGNNDLQIQNHMHGGRVILTGQDGAGDTKNILLGDPDGETSLFHAGILRLQVGAGGIARIRSDGNTDTESRQLVFEHANATDRAIVGFTTDGTFRLRNIVTSANITLEARDSGVANVSVFKGDPDGPAEMYFAGVRTALTQGSGWAIRGATNDDPVVADATLITLALKSQDDNLYGSLAYNNSADLSMTNFARGGILNFAGQKAASGFETLATMDPDGAVELFNTGVVSLTTLQTGLEIHTNGSSTTLHWKNSSNDNAARIYTTTSNLGIRSENDGGTITLEGLNAGSSLTTILQGDPDNDIALRYAGVEVFRTALRTATDRGTGAEMVDGGGTMRPVGLNVSPIANTGGNTNLRLANTSDQIRCTSTITVDVDTTTNSAPDGSHWSIANESGGNVTITATGVTLVWLNGAGGGTGTRTLADDSYCEVIKRADGQYQIIGNGLT